MSHLITIGILSGAVCLIAIGIWKPVLFYHAGFAMGVALIYYAIHGMVAAYRNEL